MKKNIINKTMIEAAVKAGGILSKAFEDNSTKEIRKGKKYYDVVSKADLDSENLIIKSLTSRLPNINILSEERGFIDNKSPDTIVIDPLDGSSNFLLGIPHFSIALAYFHNGEIIASVVYNPILKKMYFAQKDKGVFLNDKKIISKTKKDSPCISINFNHKAKWSQKRRLFDKAYQIKVSRVMNNWSPNLDFCLLAENKIDAVVSSDSLIFDFAPGFLIAKESGCVEFPKMPTLKIRKNSSLNFVIANNKKLSKELYNMI